MNRFFAIFLIFQFFFISFLLAENPPLKEFRGVWIATVNNIDWPSAPGLPVETQKKELEKLIDRIEQLNLNVVIFQIRPASDAFYHSNIEPWSYFLTGKQGMAPKPYFDPLAYAIELCHSKGMELHAWFNPFRVRNNGYYPLAPNSFAEQNHQYTQLYDGKLFLDPGIPQVRTHIINVIMEVVRNYDIDAVHFDDYFYPYPVKGRRFPDSKTFARYGNKYYPNRLGDWRRENINKFIAVLHDSIKSVRPIVKLGISPFGVWRNKSDDPNGSPGVKATTSYDDLYADVYKWLKNDWIDYIIPQLYWEQGNIFGDFTLLAQWWNDHNFGKPLYLGQALYKSTGGNKRFTNPKEISEQISILRKFKNVNGFALYSATHLTKLSDIELNELRCNLLQTKVETPHNTRAVAMVQRGTPIAKEEHTVQPVIIHEVHQQTAIVTKKKETITPAEAIPLKVFPDTIKTTVIAPDDKVISVPEKFEVTKTSKGWQISWQTSRSTHNGVPLKFSMMIFEPIDGGGFQEKDYATTDQHQIFIPRKSTINPQKVLFGVKSIGKDGIQSQFPKLFRIKGKHIIFN